MRLDELKGAAAPEANALVGALPGTAVARRRRFVIPLTMLSLGLYPGLLASVLYLPELLSSRAIGPVSFGILVVVAQLAVAASTFLVYCWWANRFEHQARHLAEVAQQALMHGHC